MELHGCSDQRGFVRAPAWETIGYNDRRILSHPLKHKAIVWMEDQDDAADHSLALEIVSGDFLDWRTIIRGMVGNGSVLEHAGGDGTTKRSLGIRSAEESMVLDVMGGKHMTVSNADALTVNAPASDALMSGVRGRSVSPTKSPDRVDSGKPSLVRPLPFVNVLHYIFQTDRRPHVGSRKGRTDRRGMLPCIWVASRLTGNQVADSLLGPCTPCKTRASLCTIAYSVKTGKPLQSCGECNKKRKKCFYGDERPPIPRDRGRTKSRAKSRGPSKTGTNPATSGSLAPRRGNAGATRSRASSRHRSMTRAPMPSSKPSCCK